MAVALDPSGLQTIELDVSVESKMKGRGAVQVAYLFVDADGRMLGSPSLPPALQVASGSAASVMARTPGRALDGVFQMRIIVSASDGEADTISETPRYFQVAGGDVRPITSDEWYEITGFAAGKGVQ